MKMYLSPSEVGWVLLINLDSDCCLNIIQKRSDCKFFVNLITNYLLTSSFEYKFNIPTEYRE